MGRADLSERLTKEGERGEQLLPSEILLSQPKFNIPLPSGFNLVFGHANLPKGAQVIIAGHRYDMEWDDYSIYVTHSGGERLVLGDRGSSLVEIEKSIKFWNDVYSSKP